MQSESNHFFFTGDPLDGLCFEGFCFSEALAAEWKIDVNSKDIRSGLQSVLN